MKFYIDVDKFCVEVSDVCEHDDGVYYISERQMNVFVTFINMIVRSTDGDCRNA